MTAVSAHYDERYFAGQSADALFSGAAELRKFQPFIRPTDTVVDLGCGGGFLLAKLDCAKRIGVDVNPAALQNCQQLGLLVVDDLARIDDNCADVVISNHALEHMTDPYEKLLQVRRTLKSNGTAVFVVPCERYDFAFRPDDSDRHLYTWSPMNLGNLFQSAGFQVIECREYVHRWPPGRHAIVKLVGWTAFHLIARVYGVLSRRHSQVRIIARKS
jgi:SAM-dependent methyltransferase